MRERRAADEARRERRAAVTDADVVMEAAAAFLAVRSRSVAETRRRLIRLGYPSALCDAVVARLVDTGYLDDASFARAWVESRDRARPRGAAALRRELGAKGISQDVIREVLAEREQAAGGGDDHATSAATDADTNADRAAARRLLQRRAASLAREPDGRRRRARAYALLARHGFSPDICAEVAAELLDDAHVAPAEGV